MTKLIVQVTTLQCGCFVGALAAGPIADKLGRRPSLLIAAVLAIIGTIMQAAASGEIAAIYTGRFIAGLGVGGASMVTPLYSEFYDDISPDRCINTGSQSPRTPHEPFEVASLESISSSSPWESCLLSGVSAPSQP